MTMEWRRDYIADGDLYEIYDSEITDEDMKCMNYASLSDEEEVLDCTCKYGRSQRMPWHIIAACHGIRSRVMADAGQCNSLYHFWCTGLADTKY